MKKIKLKLKDSRKNYSKPTKKPYYLFLEIGKECFYFSNKEKANRWLLKFEKQLNFLIRDIFKEYNHLFKLNISLLNYVDFTILQNFRSSLNFNIERYSNLLDFNFEISILREVKNFFYCIVEQNKFYLSYLRKNNRFQFLYQETLNQKRNLIRLEHDINFLFSSTNSLKKITNKENNFLNFLRIA